MAVNVKVKMGDALVEVSAANPKDLFAELASYAEILQKEPCGLCNGPTVWDHRQPKGFDYYEFRCVKCGARMQFGQNKEGGTLFAKRHEHPKSNGWSKFQRDGGGGQGASPPQDDQYQAPPPDDF
jgi:hypothetical protein